MPAADQGLLRIFWLTCSVFLLGGMALFDVSHAANKQDISTEPSVKRQHLLPLEIFLGIADADEFLALSSLKEIEQHWHPSSAAMLVEAMPYVQSYPVQAQLNALLNKISGQQLNDDIDAAYHWLWSTNRPVHPEYAEFKAQLYSPIDPRFREYFSGQPKTSIRLDEIRWGGVRRDGIPPLKNPKMIPAREAAWLQDDNIVFGVAIDGDVRAYPKRILAWHEMFKDRIAGREMAGVYCTLCGALVLYDVTVGGVQHELGTSGFLYRSNKLMYDHATKSMWSTLTGSPVVGPLVGKGIELKSLYVVTTTWKEWRTRHPDTRVLSLDTGYQRDYGEGVAYHDYFASDNLMFTVSRNDSRLPNKAEVLALRLPRTTAQPLAIAANFLAAHPVYHARIGKKNLLILTDASGANRVYESGQIKFADWDNVTTVRDIMGKAWRLEEAKLIGPGGEILNRFPAHRAFWFGWYAAFPNTLLVK
jgi:Protein of unknown function (DUF3179)